MKPQPKPGDDRADHPSPLALAFCLFSLSFSTVLFTLSVFKLLSFFIMPSLFFDLLFIGFPVGAFLGARFFPANAACFRKTLWILLGTAVFSTVACFISKNFDYLRAHLYDVEIPKLLGQIGAFTGLFIPFFCGYGLSEYIGYQVGRERLRGRMRLVYALYLFGAAAAYLFIRTGLARLGIGAMLAISLGGIVLGLALLASGRHRLALGAAAGALILLGILPGVSGGSSNPVERGFLHLYKGTSPQSSKDLIARSSAQSLFHRWGKYSFCEILWSERTRTLLGLYNDFFQWEYSPGSGFLQRSLGAVPLWLAPEGGKVAIIGSGGGRQVQYGRRFRFKKITAIEIEAAVVGAVRGPLKERFDGVYEDPRVEVVVGEARSFMEKTPERYDLIYLPSVGGYPQMMLEPGNLIRTHEAYRTLRDRLTPGGVLAIWYPAGLDGKKILTDQYVRTLRALDMDALALEAVNRHTLAPYEFLILAAPRDPAAPPGAVPRPVLKLPELQGSKDPLKDFLRVVGGFFVTPWMSEDRTAGVLSNPEMEVKELPVPYDPLFTPITDEKPFLAGNVRHILSTAQVFTLFASLASVLAVASLAVIFLLWRRGDSGIPGRSTAGLFLVCGLIGANFLLAEHYLVLALFKKIFVFYDSLVLGAVGFLVLSGLGSILITPRWRLPLQFVAAAAMLALLCLHLEILPESASESIGAGGMLVLFVPVAFVTGSFFPGIFELAAKNPLGVFALDAIGAGFGSLASFFLPIAFGFRAFFIFAAAVFVATIAAYALFVRGGAANGGVGEGDSAR